jgi:hypothetical protein
MVPATRGLPGADVLDMRARLMVIIRVRTRTDGHQRSRARGFIMAD